MHVNLQPNFTRSDPTTIRTSNLVPLCGDVPVMRVDGTPLYFSSGAEFFEGYHAEERESPRLLIAHSVDLSLSSGLQSRPDIFWQMHKKRALWLHSCREFDQCVEPDFKRS